MDHYQKTTGELYKKTKLYTTIHKTIHKQETLELSPFIRIEWCGGWDLNPRTSAG